MGTAIGAVIDYLVTQLGTAAPVVDPTVVVGDNFPPAESQSLIIIGRTLPTDATASDGTQVPIVMGLNKRLEEFSIAGFIHARRNGPAQKPSRDAAIALFDCLSSTVAADPTFGGALLDGRYGYLSNVRMVQTEGTAKDPAAMRSTLILFDVHCQNHYKP